MFKNGSSYITTVAFFIGLGAIYLLTLKGGIIPAFLFACLPAIAIVTAACCQKQYYFYVFFVINYVITGIDRYIPLKIGMIMLGLTLGIGSPKSIPSNSKSISSSFKKHLPGVRMET